MRQYVYLLVLSFICACGTGAGSSTRTLSNLRAHTATIYKEYKDVEELFVNRYKKFAGFTSEKTGDNFPGYLDPLNDHTLFCNVKNKMKNFVSSKFEDMLTKSSFVSNLFLLSWLGDDAEKVLEVNIKQVAFVVPTSNQKTKKTVDHIALVSKYIKEHMGEIIDSWSDDLFRNATAYSRVFQLNSSAIPLISSNDKQRFYDQQITYNIKHTNGVWSNKIISSVYGAQKRFINDILLGTLIKDTSLFYINHNPWPGHRTTAFKSQQALIRALTAIANLNDEKEQNTYFANIVAAFLDPSVYSECPFTIYPPISAIATSLSRSDTATMINIDLYKFRQRLVLSALSYPNNSVYAEAALEEKLSKELNLKDNLHPDYQLPPNIQNAKELALKNIENNYIFDQKSKANNILSLIRELIRDNILDFNKMIVSMNLPLNIVDNEGQHQLGEITRTYDKNDKQGYSYSDALIAALLIELGHLKFKEIPNN